MKKIFGFVPHSREKTDQLSLFLSPVEKWELSNFERQYEKNGFSRQLIYQNRWFSIDLKKIEKISQYVEDQKSILNFYRLLSFNSNGYIREYSLEVLIKNIDKQNIPFILERLNDHVEVIRNKTFNLIKIILKNEYRTLFFKNFKLINHLQTKKHPEAQEAYLIILKFLLENDDIKDFIPIADDKTRRIIANTLIAQEYDKYYLSQWFLNDSSFIIRKNVLKYTDELSQDELLSLSHDSSSQIRKAMLYWISENGTDSEKLEYYKKKLLDKSHSVRVLAQFYLKKLNFDISEYYKQSFQKETIDIVFLGLININDSSLVQYAKQYLNNDIVKIKIASFLYLAHFEKEYVYNWVLDNLRNEESKLQKHLFVYLNDYLTIEVETEIINLLEYSTSTITQHRCLIFLGLFKSSNSLKKLLQFTQSSNQSISKLAENIVRNRLTKLMTRVYLDENQFLEISPIINEYLDKLEPQQKNDNEFMRLLKDLSNTIR